MELDALFSFVMPEAKGCPPQTAEHHIRQAIIKFTEKTLSWQVALPEITTIAGTEQYALTLPAGSSLVKLLQAAIDTQPYDLVDRARGLGADSTTQGPCIWSEDLKAIKVYPVPSDAGRKIKLLVAVKPMQTATTIDPDLFERHAQSIATGALSTLLAMGNVTWADPRRALELKEQFASDMSRTASRVSSGFSRSKRSVRPFTR